MRPASVRLPEELQLFGHEQFDAEEFVRGVCRESSTGAQIRRKLQTLSSLQAVAKDQLLKGAQEQAGTYVAATKKIRATARELGALVRQLEDLEEGLADLDEALAATLGEPPPRRPGGAVANDRSNGASTQSRGQKIPRTPQSQRGRSSPPEQRASKQPNGGGSGSTSRSRQEQLLRLEEQKTPPPPTKQPPRERSLQPTTEQVSSSSSSRAPMTRDGSRTARDAEQDAGSEALEAVDSLLVRGQLGLAVARWLRLSRDLRKAKKRLDARSLETWKASVETRRVKLAAAVECAETFDGDATRLFGFGVGLREAARGDATPAEPPAFVFGDDLARQRDGRCRDAMLHALGRKRHLEARLGALSPRLEAICRNDRSRFWEALAFVAADAFELFKSTEPRKAAKVEAELLNFAVAAVAALVDVLADDLFARNLDKRPALAAAARLARLAKAGSTVFDAAASWPPGLTARRFLLAALAPKLAAKLGPPLDVSPAAIEATLADAELAAAVAGVRARLQHLDDLL